MEPTSSMPHRAPTGESVAPLEHEDAAFITRTDARPFRKRGWSRASRRWPALGALLLGVLISWASFTWAGTPHELALEAENATLREQLAQVEVQTEQLAAEIAEVAQRDRELYRMLLSADPLTHEAQQLGTGGHDRYAHFDRYRASTATLLRKTAQTLDQLEARVQFQMASFKKLMMLADQRSRGLEQLPAILPASGPIVSGFGVRHHVVLGVERMHEGIDVLVEEGSPVVATGDGIVQVAGFSASYGNLVEVAHPEAGFITRYAHLSNIPAQIRPGRKVSRGEQIGLSGSTGLSSGPHLHYEVRDAEDRAVDPMPFVAPSMTPVEYQGLAEAAEQSRISLD